MRRLWSLLLIILVAACSSAPTRVSRAPPASNATASNRTFTTPSGFPNFVDHSVGREEISIQAMSLVGVPYRWGGNTPEAGFDCSGLVRYVVDRAASVNLPRTTADMSVRGEAIEPDEVAPGDLIFFNTTGRLNSHIGIYVGKLRFVNAPSTGGTVRLDYLTNPYWAKRFDGIRRVAPPKAVPAPFDVPTYLASPVPVPAPADGASSRSPTQVAAQTSDHYEPPPSLSAVQRQPAQAMTAAPGGSYRTAADAFALPPTPTARLAAQQVRSVQEQQSSSVGRIPASNPAAHVMRASTNSLTPTHPAATDDLIAKFANGSY
ncbi:MAG: Cell wall-associated hydrolases (invasion-associated proteins) [uncultured Caballeronia sp.]|nr:MAG: Cell wall-associated hydrolases (invasion-associated proteins) [uncultured Caballeronia sp.]